MPNRPMYESNRRDMYGNVVYGMDQRKERRRKRRRAEGWRSACVAILIIILLAMVAAYSTYRFSHRAAERAVPKVQEDQGVRYVPISETETNDGTIQWFEFVDPKTRVHYLVNDRGGCLYRLDEYGNVMGDGHEEL